MDHLRIVFAGTPEFAAPSLNALLRDPTLDVVAVYTRPDRPTGRGRRVQAGPIKKLATEHAIAVEQPVTLTAPDALERLAAYRPHLLVVAAYGLILPRGFLEIPEVPLNVHASELPRWRGAAPIQRAIMAGDTTTGISIMRIVERLDAGPVWLTRTCPIEQTDTGGTLHDRLAALGGEALVAAIARYRRGEISEQAQDERHASYAAKLTAADRRVDWSEPADAIARRIRALDPAPGAHAPLGGADVKLFSATASESAGGAAPGTLLERGPDVIRVAAGTGSVAIGELQPPGRQRMSAAAFLNGYGQDL